MPSYNNLEALVAAANKKCNTILKKDVAPVAKKIMKEHIENDIYAVDVRKPNGWINGETYKRRHQLPNKVTGWVLTEENTLYVTSTAPANQSIIKGYSFEERYPGSFLELLEVGNMGFWRKNFPRPAVERTQEEINTSAEIAAAIQAGVNREFS